MVNDISCHELQVWTAECKPFFLLDVRELHERDAMHIGGSCIPMAEVMANHGQIPANIPVVIYCSKGIRSTIVVQRLQDKFGMTNLYNLKGGLTAWQNQQPK